MIDPFDECRIEAFRYEGLPDYKVSGSDERFAEYQRTGRISDDANSDWTDTVRSLRERGCHIRRLRALSDPPSAYEDYELNAGYRPGIKSGEEIRAVGRDTLPISGDFWAFDDKWIQWIDYGPDGEYLGSRTQEMTADDLKLVDEFRNYFNAATVVNL